MSLNIPKKIVLMIVVGNTKRVTDGILIFQYPSMLEPHQCLLGSYSNTLICSKNMVGTSLFLLAFALLAYKILPPS